MFRFSVRPNRAHLVNWREWGPEAFQEAQQQGKLVALFITAFWCGFCQRMDENALSGDEVITLLNGFFVPIRVEESQRPDVDLRYNQNGWPTIVFLTPDGGQLFTVNHMDPEPFANILAKTANLYQEDKEALLDSASPIVHGGLGGQQDDDDRSPLAPPLLAEIAGMVEGLADQENGGYGTQFKFLHTEANEFLLYLYEATGESNNLDHVVFTLDKMRRSATFDGKDGGFFRYSSQPDWNEPHPEKLLDDQASLLRNFLHAYLLTGDASHRESAEGLIEYMDSTLWDESKRAFHGCQDYVRETASPAPALDSQASPMISVIDEYIYCDANARAASAYLDAWWVLGREDCLERARQVLGSLWRDLRAPGGGMYHYSDGQPHAPGMLTDAVAAGAAFLDAFAVLHEEDYLDRAKELAAEIIQNHRSGQGGFLDISQTGPASLQIPIPVLTQNALAAAFFVRLADLTGDLSHREQAVWAMKSFPNSHRKFGAFAAGFGHALGRLLSLPLVVTVAGEPGTPEVRALAKAALTQMGHGDLVLRFRQDHDNGPAKAEFQLEGRFAGSIADPDKITPEMVKYLGHK
ncbi:MAG: thioredoxin domain-containing protein [Chloroflexi bacterium]|nr:thioredoxin domain-containing protein [Chloroflexota bacterium]